MSARGEARLEGRAPSSVSEPLLWSLCALSEEGRLAAGLVRRVHTGTEIRVPEPLKARLAELCERFERDLAELEAAVESLMATVVGTGSLP
jgi:hypothetical protein